MAFLDALGSSISGGIGGAIGQGILGLLGKKDRPSWRDMQFMMDTSERLAPRDIALQGQYLEGLAPAQAGAYNTYQNETYGADTQRQIDRIKATGDQLGMSPWEVTGASGAAPLPSPSFGGGGQAPGRGDFMSAMVPLKVAEMNNKTALAQTAMQTQAQERIASQQTAGGKLPEAQVVKTAAETLLTNASVRKTEQDEKTGMAQEAQAWAQQDFIRNNTMLASLDTLAKWAGSTKVNLPGIEQTTTNNYPALLQMYSALVDHGTDSHPQDRATAVQAYVAKIPPDQFRQLERDAKRAARAALSLAGDTAKGFLDGVGKFFGQ